RCVLAVSGHGQHRPRQRLYGRAHEDLVLAGGRRHGWQREEADRKDWDRETDQAIHTDSFVRGTTCRQYQILTSNRPVPWHFHDVRPRYPVVPRLPLGVPEDPQASKTEHGQRENARETAHQRVGEPQRAAVHTHDPELTDDAADGGAFPGPEPDVIREHQYEHGAVVVASGQVQYL